ncbi:MAG: NAD+ synthase [Kiritimatiellae bacterium]|nr:NAD+ synthase [Kiritimatiellia bacterium]
MVQIDVTVGALVPNADKIVREAAEAVRQGASVVVFPELALSGYPPEDLVLKRHFLQDCEKQLAGMAKELPRDAVVIVGSPRQAGEYACNAAVVFAGGRIAASYRKMLLPNYGVFDEERVFVEGRMPMVLELGPARIGLHICEDSWHVAEKPCALLADKQLAGLVNLSASPYHRGKGSQREEALRKAALSLKTHVLCCNLVGGQDELVFDGASFVLAPDGRLPARARQFERDVLFFELPVRGADRPTPPVPSREGTPDRESPPPEGWSRDSGTGVVSAGIELVTLPMLSAQGGSASGGGKTGAKSSKPWKPTLAPPLADLAEVWAALKLGLRDYVDKNGFSGTIVALSGGIDSALVATLAVDALGPERVSGITMPSRFSSAGTRGDAAGLAENLGIKLFEVPIQELFEEYLGRLKKLWPDKPMDVTEENLQARIRGNLVMALSNKFGWLVLSTGNKSELATGYCTLYGDMVGGFALLKDVPKTLVFKLARWRNEQDAGAIIPPSTIARPPSAELREDQKDTDTLPPYDLLDRILERYVEQDKGPDDIMADGFDPAVVKRVIRMVDLSEYKRRQGPPGIKITPKAFGRDRRMPITNLYWERI